MRDVIVHYHIFKNAGTSIDRCLEGSYGPRWQNFDVDEDWANITTDELAAHLLAHPYLVALSSHQARWPEPSGPDLHAHPIVFLRHPLDRVGSMYAFAVHRDEEFARGRDLGAYVDALLDPAAGFVARSAQTLYLSDDDALTKPPGPATEVSDTHLRQARRRLEALPVVGLVERFDESVDALGRWLVPTFPDLVLVPRRDNASQWRPAALEERLAALRAELGESRYRRVEAANAADIELWEAAGRLFEERWAGRRSAMP